MNAKSKTRKSKETPRWLDSAKNVRKIIVGFYGLCALIILIDLIFSLGWHKHAALGEDSGLHTIETLPLFMGYMGFLHVSLLSMCPN